MAPSKKPAAARRASAASRTRVVMKAMKAKNVLKAMKARKPVKAIMAMKAMKAGRPRASTLKKPPVMTKGLKARKAVARPSGRKAVPKELQGLVAYVVNLERRPDRWRRVSKMLKKETPWLVFHQHKASDGTQNPIPEAGQFSVATQWNTSRNARFADYYEWVFVAPGSPLDGTPWKFAADVDPEDVEWRFAELAEKDFMFIRDAPGFSAALERMGSVEKIATGETFKVRLQFAQRCVEPGLLQNMSGGERGCAHSHMRLWRIALDRMAHTLILEDDVHFLFDRSGELGKANGKVFTERLGLALRYAPSDFDVIYLGWSGWRGGNHFFMKEEPEEDVQRKRFIRKAEYVWTTVAYVITSGGARKLLAAVGDRVDQPVDNFMAWEASKGRLNSYVCVDEGDDDGTWAGGIVDQFDFQGDSDIKKSDGGEQGDDAKEFVVAQ